MKRPEDKATDFGFALKRVLQVPVVCPGHTRPLTELQYSGTTPDGVFLISGCHDKLPMLRRGDNGDWIGTYAGHKGAVWSAKLDGGAQLAATGAADFSAKVWDAITGGELSTFPHKHIVKSVEFSPTAANNSSQAAWLATGGHEGKLRVFDLATSALAFEADAFPTEFGKVQIQKVVWSHEISTLFTASVDGIIRLWDVRAPSGGGAASAAREIDISVEGASGKAIQDIELGRDGAAPTLLAASGEHVTLIDAVRLEIVRKYDLGVRALFKEEGGASMHPSGERFVAGGSDLMVRVFDASNGAQLEEHQGHHGPVRCIRYAPDGASYVTGSEDGTIRLWQTHPPDTGS